MPSKKPNPSVSNKNKKGSSKAKKHKSQKKKRKTNLKGSNNSGGEKRLFTSKEVALQKSVELYQTGQLQRALKVTRQALLQFPDNAVFLNNGGMFLAELREYDEAEIFFRNALRTDPNYGSCYNNLGNILRVKRHFKESEFCFQHALNINPNNSEIYNNIGNLYKDQKRNNEAETCYQQALSIDSDYPDARFNLAMLYLATGRCKEGWPLYEARYHPRKSLRQAIPPTINKPQWNGESLSGKTLLVWAEQGFGDSIQYVRFLPLLKEKGVSRLILACSPRLSRLFVSVLGIDEIITVDDLHSYDARNVDYWCFMMSIPLHLQTELDSIPANIPYLTPPSEDLAQWSTQMPSSPLRVGLVWKGNAEQVTDVSRSLSSLKVLKPLWNVKGINFISLQRGAGEDEAENPPSEQPLVHIGTLVGDFANTAAAVSQLDLVISTDTAMVHLAGAVGIPCWVLLCDGEVDWRWLQERDDSPWYPDVMRLFRQEKDGDWESVVKRIEFELEKLVTTESVSK